MRGSPIFHGPPDTISVSPLPLIPEDEGKHTDGLISIHEQMQRPVAAANRVTMVPGLPDLDHIERDLLSLDDS